MRLFIFLLLVRIYLLLHLWLIDSQAGWKPYIFGHGATVHILFDLLCWCRRFKGTYTYCRQLTTQTVSSTTDNRLAPWTPSSHTTNPTAVLTLSLPSTPAGMTGPEGRTPLAPGYEQYSKSLLEVPYTPAEYGEASSDDLSSEWDSDVPEARLKVSSAL